MYKPIVQKAEIELFHGTTLARALQIEADQAFRHSQAGLYVVFRSNRDLAEFFARRAARKEGGRPVVVKAVVETDVSRACASVATPH